MKLKHLFAVAALAALGSEGLSAQTVIRIVASNGDRGATQTAISKVLAAGWTFQGTAGLSNASNLSTVTSTNFGAWNGTFQGNPVVIKVSYSGALAAISAIAGNTEQRFVVSNGTGSANLPNPLTGTNPGVDYESHTADFGFSTNFQSTSPFRGVYQGKTYSTVNEEIVGVSPLGFYASNGFPAASANITTQQAQLLYSSGNITLAVFTGDYTNDREKYVYALGRNTDAGQRFGAYSEIGLGTNATVKVYQPTYSTQPTTTSNITYGGVIGSHIPWPAETVNDIYSPEGSGGFATGALLSQYLTATLDQNAYKNAYVEEGETFFEHPNATAGYYIGYATTGDARPRVLGSTNVVPTANQGVALSYNGVALTDANVQSGKYTAWLYNRLLRPQSGIVNSTASLFATALAAQIKSTDAVVGGGLLNDSTFKVKRSTDGGLVIPKQ